MFKLFFKFSDVLMTVPFYGDNGLMYKIYNHGIKFWKKYLSKQVSIRALSTTDSSATSNFFSSGNTVILRSVYDGNCQAVIFLDSTNAKEAICHPKLSKIQVLWRPKGTEEWKQMKRNKKYSKTKTKAKLMSQTTRAWEVHEKKGAYEID